MKNKWALPKTVKCMFFIGHQGQVTEVNSLIWADYELAVYKKLQGLRDSQLSKHTNILFSLKKQQHFL